MKNMIEKQRIPVTAFAMSEVLCSLFPRTCNVKSDR